MNNGSRRTLNRHLAYLKRSGCDFNKMNEYYGYKDTENHIRKISLMRDPTLANVFKLTITQKKRELNPLQTYIDNLPRDMNNVIYSYLYVKRELNYLIEIPNDFPFRPLLWSIVSFKENDVSKYEDIINPNEMYCGNDFSPAMTLESQILLHLSGIPWFHD